MPNSNELYNIWSMWSHTGLTPLGTIKGYTDLLLEGFFGELTDEQYEALTVIKRSCDKAITSWWHPSDYMRLQYGSEDVTWEAVHLPELMSEVRNNLRAMYQINSVEVTLPNNVPAVRGEASWLVTAMINLLFIGDTTITSYLNPRLPPQATFALSREACCVHVEVTHAHHATSTPLPAGNVKSNLFQSGTRLDVARQIVEKHRSQLRVHVSEKEITFRFELYPFAG